MTKLAIITARGGSKRIPRKNIRDFCGQPILAYSIQAARGCAMFDEVMVSTDSEEIAAVACDYGATVPFLRSEVASGDYATTADAVAEVLTEYEKRGRRFDCFACLYPTAPFLTAHKLRDAMTLFEREKADGVISVARYSYPPQRAFIIRDGRLAYCHPEFETARSQDLESIYHDCGQFYICSCDEFRASHSLVLPNTLPFVLPEREVQDIDTLSDWAIAEEKYRALLREE